MAWQQNCWMPVFFCVCVCVFSHHMQITLSGPPAMHHHLNNSKHISGSAFSIHDLWSKKEQFAPLQNEQGNKGTLYKDDSCTILGQKCHLVKFMFLHAMRSHTYKHILCYRKEKNTHKHLQTLWSQSSAQRQNISRFIFLVLIICQFQVVWLFYYTICTACSRQRVYPTFFFLIKEEEEVQESTGSSPVNSDGMIQGWTSKWFFLCESWKASSLLCCSWRRCTVQAMTRYVSLGSFHAILSL